MFHNILIGLCIVIPIYLGGIKGGCANKISQKQFTDSVFEIHHTEQLGRLLWTTS